MNTLIKNVSEYYTAKLEEFGTTAKGVDWNSEESQFLRFEKLLSFIDLSGTAISLLDYGCGFGSLLSYLGEKNRHVRYTGFDVTSAMIVEAKKKFSLSNSMWTTILPSGETYDYAVASGVFNVRLQNTDRAWLDYMQQCIGRMNDFSVKGFSFNVLSNTGDEERKKDYLYYADAEFWMDYCRKKFSGHVTLLNDYPLFEFTIQVTK